MPFKVSSQSQLFEKVAEAIRANQYVLILWMGPRCHVCTQFAVPAFAEAEASGSHRNIMFLEMEWEAFFVIGGWGPAARGHGWPKCISCSGERVTGVPAFHLFRTSRRHIEPDCHEPDGRFGDGSVGPVRMINHICCFDSLVGWDETQFSGLLSKTLQPPNPLSIGITLCDSPAGVTIETVAKCGPADLSGQVFPGDIIVSFDGTPCNRMKKLSFTQLMSQACSAGSEVELALMRGDTSPSNVRMTPVRIDSFVKTPWFVQFEKYETSQLSHRRDARFHIGVGCVDKDGCAGPVIGTVEPGGPAALSGQVFPDDVVLSCNDVSFKELVANDLHAFLLRLLLVATATDVVKLELQREGVPEPIVVTLAPAFTKPTRLGLSGSAKYAIDSRPAGVSIASVDPRGPAGLSGQVFPDDLILSYNDVSCKGLTLAEVQALFRSKSEGSFFAAPDNVKLELQRDGFRHPVIVNLTPAFYDSPLFCRCPGWRYVRMNFVQCAFVTA